MSGGLPIDLILFAMIAAFLVLRLRSVLGKRTGFERPPQVAPLAGSAAPVPAEPRASAPIPLATRALPDTGSETGRALARMTQIDPSFDPTRFLGGAEQAFRIIVGAFAAGQRDVLRPLLSPDTFAAFEAAISAREAAGEVQRSEIRAIPSATIETASLLDRIATIAVRFVSDQINETRAADGTILAGTDAVTELVDLWTFQRTLGAADPTWHLIEARSA